MQSYENIYNSICRLCLNYSDCKNMVPLIDENSKDGLTPYAKAVSTFAQIRFTKHDCFPSNMCPKCLCLLKQAIQFKLVTESNDNCLQQLKLSVGVDGENLKGKIIEYTMLKFYFPTEFFKISSKFSKTRQKENSQITHITENNQKNLENQSADYNIIDGDIFETAAPESDIEQNQPHNETLILDKIENLVDSNVCKPTVSIQVFRRKQNGSTKRRLKAQRMKHKLAMKQKSVEKKFSSHSRVRKNLVCNVCDRVLANQLTYDHHMQRHTGCRYICEHCGKGFPVLNELQIHQVTKHGTGRFLQCTQCPFKAPRKFDLIEHERIHSGERPYTCDKCGLTFRRRGIWRKHLIYHTEKKVQCPQCPRKFYQRSDMLAHANNIHDRVYVYTCSKCGATYTKTETVRRHMTERHGIPREMQGKIIRVKQGASYQE